MADLKSWNLWHGCSKYSEGCANCYMFVLDKAHKVPESSTKVVRTRMFNKPLETNRKGYYKIPSGYTLRINMTSDTFIEEADPWRKEMWDIIRKRPDVIFYILTKRFPRIPECLPADWGDGWENVIGGVPSDKPIYMRLATKADMDNCIDIRTDDVKAFIKANKR